MIDTPHQKIYPSLKYKATMSTSIWIKRQKNPVTNNIPKQKNNSEKSTYKHWGWDGIDWRKLEGKYHDRAGLSGFGW